MLNTGQHNLRVTLRDVAKHAGVGLATASRAMRDDPATTVATREKVKGVAAEIGYRPDPAMSRLIERRWSGRRVARGMNVGYLYNRSGKTGQMGRQQWEKFCTVAEAEGYSLIEEDLSEFVSAEKLMQRLRAQGVEGLLVSLLPEVPYELDAVFAKLPAVSIGVSHYRPKCPIILHDEFSAITEIFERLQALGYRRIGVVLANYPNSVSTDLRMGAILCRRSMQRPQKNRIPILFYRTKEYPFDDEFGKWVEKQKVDVVLADSHEVLERVQSLGFKIPVDFGFATFNLWQPDLIGTVAGYYRDNNSLCAQALRLLNMMIRTERTGSHNAGLLEMVAGEWKDGSSLPKK